MNKAKNRIDNIESDLELENLELEVFGFELTLESKLQILRDTLNLIPKKIELLNI